MAAEKKAPPIEERELYIARLMSSGKYHSFKTVTELAEEWGLSHHTVQKDANAAARALRSPPEELEGLRARMAVFFETIASEALTTPNMVTGVPDYRSSMEAMKLYGQYAGLRIDEDEAKNDMGGNVTINITHAAVDDADTDDSVHQGGPEQVPGSDSGASGS